MSAVTVDRLLDAIAVVTARHPLPGPRIGLYAVPVAEVHEGRDLRVAAGEYLTWLLAQFGGDVRAALAAYAQGPGIRATWSQLERDWDALRLVLDDRTVAFVERVMVEVNRRAKRTGDVHR